MASYNAKLNVYQIDGCVYNPDGSRHYEAELQCLSWESIEVLPEAIVMALVQKKIQSIKQK